MRFGPTFACCSTARTLLIVCALTLSGTMSILALRAGLTRYLPPVHPRMMDWAQIACIVAYVLALFLSLVGTVSLFIHGLKNSGEIVIRGSRYRGMILSKIALSIFILPWIVLAMLRFG